MADRQSVDTRLRLARQALSPSDEHRLRVRSALAARLAAEGPTVAHAARAARPIPTRPVARALEAAALVAVGFALGFWFAEARHTEGEATATEVVVSDREPTDTAPAAPLEASAARAEASREPASPAPLLAEPAGALSASSSTPARPSSEPGSPAKSPGARERAHAPAAAPRATPADGFAEELALLRRAERATRSGDAALSRSLIAELDSRFPKTALRQERAALLVLVACATGEPAAQAEARDFTQRNPESVYLDRIHAACGRAAAGAAEPRARDGAATPR